MRRALGILSSFCLVLAIGCAEVDYVPVYVPNENSRIVHFKPGSEPSGFNGIHWATQLSSLKGMVHHKTDLSHGGIEFYLRDGDGLRLKGGRSLPVQYGFWRGIFYVGVVNTQGLSDWNALKEVVFDKYGEGAKPFKNKDEYLWVGKNAVMALRHDDFSGMGIFYIRSCSVEQQIQNVAMKE